MTHQTIFATYDERAAELHDWVKLHYIDEFGMRPGSLLDVGCGNGFWSGVFASYGFTVTGVDKDMEYLTDARARYPDIWFARADVDLPMLFLGRFDYVFCRCLPHFFGGPTLERGTALVRNLARHIGGMLLVSVYSDGSEQDRPQLSGELARYHTDDSLIAAIEAGGVRIAHTARIGNYFTIGAVAA